jgi:hypothetical protein
MNRKIEIHNKDVPPKKPNNRGEITSKEQPARSMDRPRSVFESVAIRPNIMP